MTETSRRPTISLALQGGGAHGAFTWGVLDALLEDDACAIEGISGTSAGAMNALCVASGLMENGRDGARAALARFWTAVADSAPFAPPPGDAAPGLAPGMKLMLQWTDWLAPEQLNPFDLNPLRDVLADQFDFARLRRDCPLRLFIAATHANSGKLRLFREHELSVDALLASACLPTLHRTVSIAGEPYWDGGYSANPAVFPLVFDCTSPDLLLVLLSPLHYAETPASAADIRGRLRELAFNSTFLREMRAFAHLREQAAPGPAWLPAWWPGGRLERRLAALRFHAISADALLSDLPSESRLTVSRPFFERLRDDGRAHARNWLARHRGDLGRRASLDLGRLFY
ncbi:MAG: patatin-like phospholipase family protein [Dechloromonas sp.]|nr:patatin-like phospholipase family protein [Dechloromonas sp.]